MVRYLIHSLTLSPSTVLCALLQLEAKIHIVQNANAAKRYSVAEPNVAILFDTCDYFSQVSAFFCISSARVPAIHHSVCSRWLVCRCLRNLFYSRLFAEINFFLSSVGAVPLLFVCSRSFSMSELVRRGWSWLSVDSLSQQEKTRVRQTRHRHISYTICAITYINVYNGWLFSLFLVVVVFSFSFHSLSSFGPIPLSHFDARTQTYQQRDPHQLIFHLNKYTHFLELCILLRLSKGALTFYLFSASITRGSIV